jgi:3-isopropylmalate/(R)-2-methylmalate dehydratase large subunit
MPRSLFDKLWDQHVVEELPGGNALIFIDLVVAHEITTPPGAIAIEKEFGDKLYDGNRIVAMIDHVAPAKDAATALQAHTIRTWAKRQGLQFHDIGNNGICHVVVPERGYVTPGMTVCCGDSHTCTLGAFGAFALGIGTTAQAGAMLAGVLILQRPKVMRIEVTGQLPPDATAKDLVMTVISKIGFRGGTGHVLEYTGSAIRALTMEQRMTLCNMAIEAGATTGIVAADETTAAYLAGTPLAPTNWKPESRR